MNDKMIIGIDPDVEMSGVATYFKGDILAESLSFPDLIERLYTVATLPSDVTIVIEAGWLNNKSNFRNTKGRKSDRIARQVGRNHQTGIHICEMARHYGLEVIEQKPFVKCWRGRDRKITHNEINKILSCNGIDKIKQTNQDKRDAILLVIVYANLKIRI